MVTVPTNNQFEIIKVSNYQSENNANQDNVNKDKDQTDIFSPFLLKRERSKRKTLFHGKWTSIEADEKYLRSGRK